MQIKEIPPFQTTPLTDKLVTKRWFAKASPTKNKNYCCFKCHCRRKVGRAHGSRLKAYSIQIKYHTLPFWYDFEYSLLKRIGLFQFDFHHSFWSICIRIPCRIWADLCKIFSVPLSAEMRSICIHVMNDFGFLWCLCRACIFVSLVTFLGGFSDFKLRG